MNIKIDDIEYFVERRNLTVFQACFNVNIKLPCFCYHERLSIAGNCRICIVQINNGLGVSCAISLIENMNIYTNNKRVKEARESVLEFLLINHPLDCPICDQAGECDLQDISKVFGSDKSRYYEKIKKAVDNFSQNGPLIKTIMTRCIHCTRCVRFANEVSEFVLGVLDRGSIMEIGTYYDINLLDELSGNIIDLCPVGALTSMPYAFKLRSWETLFYINIDFLDSLASSIRLHIYGNILVRVLPLLNESLNEEWITNRTRFSYDSLLINRIYYPKIKIQNKFIVMSWDFIIQLLFFKFNYYIISNKFICCWIGYYLDLITALSIKSFFYNLGFSNIIYDNNLNWIFNFSSFFFFNSVLNFLEYCKIFIFVACNLRLESPLLNIRIRKNYNINKNSDLFFFSYGLSLKHLTYPAKNIGNTIKSFIHLIKGKSRNCCNFFFKNFLSFCFIRIESYLFFIKPLFFLGNSITYRVDSKIFIYIFIYLFKYKFNWGSFNLINSFLGFFSFANILYNNISNYIMKFSNFIYNISSKYIDECNFKIQENFIVSQNFLINKICFKYSDLILPSTAPYEMDAIYINLEGFLKYMKQIIKPFFGIYSDWEIVSLLHLYFKTKKNLNIIKINKSLLIFNFFFFINYKCNYFISINKFFVEIIYFGGLYCKVFNNLNFLYLFLICKLMNTFFFLYINNYYNMDFYTRNSKIMNFSALKRYSIFKS
jgi:NADH-quinone oxidoreductase subunit G